MSDRAEHIEKLLEQFVDDRDALDEHELEALVDAVGADPLLAARLKDQLVMDELLAQRLAIDRRDFFAQVQQRIRDDEAPPQAGSPIQSEAEMLREMRELADEEFAARRQGDRIRRSRRTYLLIACTLLLAGAGAWWWWMTTQQTLGVVRRVSGSPTLVRRGQPQAAVRGSEVRAGDQLVTLPQESLAIRYTDGTTLELSGDTSVELNSGAAHAKRVRVQWGSLSAEVVPQPAGAPMVLRTPSAIATVRGTRLWLAADTTRTRLDVAEGVVELARVSDGKGVRVNAQEYAVASEAELFVKPLSWPVDRRDAVVLLDTGETPALVRDRLPGEFEKVELRLQGTARLDRHFAWMLDGGSITVPAAGDALRDACRDSGELTIEATVTPRDNKQSGPARIVTLSNNSRQYNFMLGQQDNRLFLRLRTTDEVKPAQQDIELCRLSAGQPQHVAVAYRPGELVCYLNGRRVYHDGQTTGDFANWRRYPLLLGDELRDDRDWRGTIEGFALYDRFLPESEVRRNLEQYRSAIGHRKEVPQWELLGALVERSTTPGPEDIEPRQAALVMCRYRVDRVIRGELDQSEVLVAQWAVLGGEVQPPAQAELGTQRYLVIERLGVNPQLARYDRFDDFSDGDDPKKPRYYDVSQP